MNRHFDNHINNMLLYLPSALQMESRKLHLDPPARQAHQMHLDPRHFPCRYLFS